MTIFLLRHAEASFQAARDEDRELTARGRRQLLAVISTNTEELASVGRIWVSPYKRAQQTLALARPYLPDSATVVTSDLLTPDQNPLGVLPLLEDDRPGDLMLVGHQPLLGRLLDWLCALEPGAVAMGTSALAAVDITLVARGLGHLRWLRQPQPE